jgi:hypothetical protein
MIWASLIQYDVSYHNQELLSSPGESPGERLLASYVDKPFSYPLPKLFLSGPELILVCANDSSVLFDFHTRLPEGFIAGARRWAISG